MENIKQNKVELLAPAGGFEQLKAAVENGADAVYIGGRKFNARMNAANFTDEEIRQAVEYAHPRGVGIFVTMNTLLTDNELQEAVFYAGKLYSMGVDAVIIQDWGLAALLRKYVPDLEMHLSTQGSVYNRSGVKNALEFGFKRVVLAREMTISEIRSVTDLCDIEVFVHGAMCMCYSGQCQMSRAIGGRSGNRGQCAQPCRLPYKDDRGKTGYFLSPKDMCAIDRLGDLISAGVASLKIEGRMKSAEYVAVVVGIYRKYIDAYYKKGRYKVSDEDREALLQIFNRGGFEEGYLNGIPENGLLSGDIPKHRGIYIGKVAKRRNSNLIEAVFDKEPEMGDGIEIRSKEVTGNIVTYIKKEKEKTVIGDIKGNVAKGAPIYRITSKKQLKLAKESYRKPHRKSEIGMSFCGKVGDYPQLTAYSIDSEVTVIGSRKYEKAIKAPLVNEHIKRQLEKTGDTPYKVSYLTINADENGTMPISELNRLRREALSELEKEDGKGRKMPLLPEKIEIPPMPQEKDISDIPYHNHITKGIEDSCINKSLEDGTYEKEVVLNNIGWIREYLDRGTKVYLGSGLNIMNGAAAAWFEKIGAKVAKHSLEEKDSPDILMITEHPMMTKTLTDRKGRVYKVEESKYGDKWIIKDK